MIITATLIINITILTTLLKIIAAKFNSNDMTMIVIVDYGNQIRPRITLG